MDLQRIESGYRYHSIALPRGAGTITTPGEYDPGRRGWPHAVVHARV